MKPTRFHWWPAALLLLLGLLAATASTPRAVAGNLPCAQQTGVARATFGLDGVELNLCTDFMAAPVFGAADPTDAIQMATALDRSAGYQEFSVQAIPFGLRSPAEDLPVAQAGGAETYRAALLAYRLQQGGQPQAGPTARFFGQAVMGLVSLGSVYVAGPAVKPVVITEWVVEAGSRLWIIRAIQLLPGDGLGAREAAGSVELTSPEVNRPSTSLAAALAPPAPASLSAASGSLSAASTPDLPAPPWWNGEVCDYTHYTNDPANLAHVAPYPLGGAYRGILACGPRPNYDSGAPNPGAIVQFYPGAWGEYEWQCVELSMRFMRQAYGIAPYSGNGKDVVWNYSGTELVKIVNGATGEVPAPGDVLSYGVGNTVGHTSVVAATAVNASGNGTLTIIEENNSVTGAKTLTVSNWVVYSSSSVTGWLHFPGNGSVSGVVKNASGQRVAGAQVRLQKWLVDLTTVTDGTGAYVFDNIPAGSASVTASYMDTCGGAEGTTTASIVAHQNQPVADLVMAYLKGGVSGVVKGPGGRLVAGAQVELNKCGVTLTTLSNASGAYAFANVPTGPVTLTATRDYASASVTADIVRSQNRVAADITLDFDDADYVADISFPDPAVFAPGQPLVKTWRMQNSGSFTWDQQYQLVFLDGDLMGSATAVSVPVTAPGQMADIPITLTAPLSGGHLGYWRLRNAQGYFFGATIFAQVNVQAPSRYLTLLADPPAPANASQVRVYARADGWPNLGALRLKLNGVVVTETRSAELYYNWSTSGYSALGHSLVVEATDWTDTAWKSPERLGLVYTLTGTSGTVNLAPDRPSLVSPPDWHAAISSTVWLCAQGTDPTGDALQYQFEISSTAGVTTTVWQDSACFTSGSLNPGAYTWRARTQDGQGAQSRWSDIWHFGLASSSAGLTRFDFEPLGGPELLRIWPCVALTNPVILSVRVNTAADASGRWDVIGEPAGPCVVTDTVPVWNTLPYSDGGHLVRVVALGDAPGAAVMSDTVYALLPRRPLTPTLLAPVSRSGLFSETVSLSARTVQFRWAPAARAVSYTLLVSANPVPKDDASPLVRQVFYSTTLTASVTLTGEAALYWQVVATNAAGVSASEAQRFSMDSLPPRCLVQTSPITGTNSVLVTWVGVDEGGSGVAAYNLRYRSAGDWFAWLVNVPAATTSAVFTGQSGQLYLFGCQAIDQAGNTGSYPGIFLPLIRR